MTTPQRAGWYPAPDRNGEQWWNGASWSESRRGAATETAPVPLSNIIPSAYVPAVPRGARPDPYRIPDAAALGPTGASVTSNPLAIAALVAGVVSVVVALIGPVAVVLGILGLRRGGPKPARLFSIVGITLGAVSSLGGLVSLVTLVVALLGPSYR